MTGAAGSIGFGVTGLDVYKDVLDLARAIGKVSRLAIYTNNGPLVKLHLDELFPEAAALFTERYCSYEFATKKPDPASFRNLLECMGVEASQCWFIDDKRSNVQGARLAGIRSHHYRQFGPLLEDARALGFEV